MAENEQKSSIIKNIFKPLPNINGESEDDFKKKYTKMALGWQPDTWAENNKSATLANQSLLNDYVASETGEFMFQPVKDTISRLIRRAHFPKAKFGKKGPMADVKKSSASMPYKIMNTLGVDKDNIAAQALQEQLANLSERQIMKLQTPGWSKDMKFVASLPKDFTVAWDEAMKQIVNNTEKLPQSDSMSMMQRYHIAPRKDGEFGPINRSIHEASIPSDERKGGAPSDWQDWLWGTQQVDNSKIARREAKIGDKLVNALRGTPFLKEIFSDAIKNYDSFYRVKDGGKGAQDNALDAFRLHWNRDYVDEDQLKGYLNAMIEKANSDENLSEEERKAIEDLSDAIKYSQEPGILRNYILGTHGQKNISALRNRFDWSEPDKKQKGIKLFDVKKKDN